MIPTSEWVYNQKVKYEWDSDKGATNLAKHGVDFESIYRFEWETAYFDPQVRGAEFRLRTIGYIGPRLHVVIFTMRGETVRIISMWEAGRRDERKYAQA